MALLRNSNLKENGKFLNTIKITMFIFLIWAFILYSNLYNTSSYFKKVYNDGIKYDIQFHRLLAKNMPKRNLYNTTLKENLSDVRGDHKIKYLTEHVSSYPQSQKSVFKNLEDDISTYKKLKKRGINNLELYKKVYKHRYAKKNFIAKMDCYCEKKLFNKFDHINELAEKYQNNQKRFKNIFFKKYGIGLIFFMLLPFLGIIIPTYLYETYLKKGQVPIACNYNDGHQLTKKQSPVFYDLRITEDISYEKWKLMTICNKALVYVLTIFVIIAIFYILIKVVKYERLKAGKGNMSLKEYCSFCKDAFNNKIS